MMNTVQFLNHLKSRGIRVWLDQDKLRFRAPPDQITDEIKTELTRRKQDVMALLRQGRSADEPELKRVDQDEVASQIPLTFAQQRLWFLDQLQSGVSAYNVYDVIDIDHEIDVAALQRAVTELVRRHELLRTIFPAIDGVPRQHIQLASDVPLPVIDLTALPAEKRELEARRLASEEASAPFDLAHGMPLRVKLIRMACARYIWLLSIHHIVSDDWSKKLINQELDTLYTAYRAGLPSPLPELPVQWSDFAIWQQRWLTGANLDAHVRYWKQQLDGELPALSFVADHPRQEPATGRNGKFFFSKSLASGLRQLCEAEGVTLFMALLAGYAALLARYTGQSDIIVGSPISDRHHVETEGLIGFLLNTLPLRVRINDQASFRDLLCEVKETCLNGYSYQAVPYEALMQDLQVERTVSGNPLFQTVLALLNTPSVQQGSSTLWGADTLEAFPRIESDIGPYIADSGNGTTKFDLSVTLIEHPEGIWGKTEYNSDVFSDASIAALIERYQVLLGAAVSDPGNAISSLPLMTEAQRHFVLNSWSRGPALPLDIVALPQFVERQARIHPSSIAIDDEGRLLNYAEFNAQANRIAHFLRKRGIDAEARVGILLDRSAAMFTTILGVLKAGAACVPLDKTYPAERLRPIADDADIAWLVSTVAYAQILPTYAQKLVCLERDAEAIFAENCEDAECIAQGDSAACVLYTSGSTGRPKGVVLTHHALINYAQNAANDYGISGSDRVLQFASIAFDASLEESLIAYCEGATLVLRPERMIDSTAAFVKYCEQLRLTMLVLPTAYWHELISTLETYPLPLHIRCIVIGGERAIPEKLAQWQRLVDDRIEVFNTYGPTEGTIAITRCLFPARSEEGATAREVSIGRPIANSSAYVLDRHMQPVPHGVPGEIYLGGAALAQGYLNQPSMTDERFVSDPFSTVPHARLYRTGDLGRYLPDGSLQYLARADAQVKIRGYRVEPREIELLLQEHDTVKDVVVVPREDQPGERRLVAYVVGREGCEISVPDLRAFLKPRLPSYMLPSSFVLLPVLPLNVNGKVNVRTLPKPDGDQTSARDGELVEPRTPIERQLYEIWKAVLQLQRIGIHENFFELGGHSLLATRVIARINDVAKIDLPLRRLFETPTISELAVVVGSLMQTASDTLQTKLPPISASPNRENLPLSFAQKRLWFLGQIDGADRAYNIPFGLKLKGRLDKLAMRRALDQIVERHEVLRTVFPTVDDEPMQRIIPAGGASFRLVEDDLSGSETPQDVLRQVIESEIGTVFDLASGPLIQGRLVKFADEEHALLVVIHHIVADGWSVGLLISEIASFYSVFHAGAVAPLLPLAVQYGDYALWQQQWLSNDVLERQVDYWKSRLADAPALLQLPTDRPRPASQDFTGESIDIELDVELTSALRRFSQEHGVTLYMTLLAGWALTLHRLSGQPNIVIGTPTANRPLRELEDVVGFFINMLALRIDFSDDITIGRLLGIVRNTFLEAHEHQHVSFEQVVKAVRPIRSAAYSPVFQGMFSWLSASQGELVMPGLQVEGVSMGASGTAKYDISLSMEERGRRITGNVEFATALFERKTVERFIACFREILREMVKNAGQQVGELTMLSTDERQQTLYAWNDAAKLDIPADYVHDLIAKQAGRTPGRTAIVHGDKVLTYAQLNVQANQLSHYLRTHYAHEGERVALCVERGPEMIVGMLAVLKAGCVYVPLDPTYSSAKLQQLLDDSAPAALLTQAHLRKQIACGVPVIDMDEDASWKIDPTGDATPETPELRSSNAACLIYSSRTADNFKGVLLRHANFTNLFGWARQAFSAELRSHALAAASIISDIALFECLAPLTRGGTVHIVADLSELTRASIPTTFINATPATLESLLDLGRLPDATRVVHLIGGSLQPRLVQRVFDHSNAETVWHCHGFSGTAGFSTWTRIQRGEPIDDHIVYRGRPIANTQLYVLDKRGYPVPIGVSGELHIGGAGVGLGYHRHDALTAERFVADPFVNQPSARMVRTGVRARWLSDGRVEYLDQTGQPDFPQFEYA